MLKTHSATSFVTSLEGFSTQALNTKCLNAIKLIRIRIDFIPVIYYSCVSDTEFRKEKGEIDNALHGDATNYKDLPD